VQLPGATHLPDISDEPGVISNLDDFDQHLVHRQTSQNHTVFLENIPVMIVEFITVAVALDNNFPAVKLAGQ
jgi:hypothetical protein